MTDPDDAVLLGGAHGIAVPRRVADALEHVSGQMPLMPDDPAALEDAAAAARAELERLDLARLNLRLAALDRLRATDKATKDAAAALDGAVAEARAAGATWQQVADATGMARPSAWQRWHQ
jgi:enamine deaminase RidA (YjgF/YER057c/UK114 family)